MDDSRQEQDKNYILKALEKQPPQLNIKKALGILEYLNGKTYNQIAKTLKVNRSTAYRWIKDYQKRGKQAIYYKKEKENNQK